MAFASYLSSYIMFSKQGFSYGRIKWPEEIKVLRTVDKQDVMDTLEFQLNAELKNYPNDVTATVQYMSDGGAIYPGLCVVDEISRKIMKVK